MSIFIWKFSWKLKNSEKKSWNISDETIKNQGNGTKNQTVKIKDERKREKITLSSEYYSWDGYWIGKGNSLNWVTEKRRWKILALKDIRNWIWTPTKKVRRREKVDSS